MAKRGYKLLEEFAAHSASVNCLNIGKKACRLFITGGDDHKVNIWAIGKPTSLMSLSGHTSPVESVAFDSGEILVLAGASSGNIKLWDLEEAKMVRTLSGHRSNCTAVEFHPFGEFFASGSRDTNLKIWDIRKKGCIHTYKGHTQGISNIKFTPDGRWVVSGGFDSAVKVWDLTAGKLLHDFKFHEGHIRSIAFHPLEFLLATGSADKTVKFWDLETFELIGSTRPEASGVRAITFHPDGRTLFAGLDESLKVYSWEPVICHDSVDMGWSTLGDFCIHDGKLLSCSFYRNSVGIWVADITNIEPYGASPISGKKESKEQKSSSTFTNSPASKSIVAGLRTSDLECMSPDYETKEIKNIYVDTTGGKPMGPQKGESLSFPKVLFPEDSKEISYDTSQRQSPTTRVEMKSNEVSKQKPSISPCDSPDGKDSPSSTKESITFSKTRRGMLLRPAHIRKPSNSKIDLEKLPVSVDSRRKIDLESSPVVVDSASICHTANALNKAPDPDVKTSVVSEVHKDSSHETKSIIRSLEEKFEKVLSPETPSYQESSKKSVDCSKGINSVKFVNGVAVVPGRTRTLVERFERREQTNSYDVQTINSPAYVPETEKTREQTNTCEGQAMGAPTHIPETEKMRERTINHEVQAMVIPSHIPVTEKARERANNCDVQTIITFHVRETDETTNLQKGEPQVSGRDSTNDRDVIEDLMQSHDVFLSSLRSRLTKLQMVRHFWERNDIKGAINAMTKLPDHSVQADVISVLIEKMDIMTLDLFSCLLPVLVGLLDSKIERHVSLSLEILLKLVAVFGHVIRSTVSAPPAVGVDLHAEQRLQCCKLCFIQLQKIQKIIPLFVRRGGVLARCAQELNLVLQQS